MNCKIEANGRKIDPQKKIRKESWWWGVNKSGEVINRSSVLFERNLQGNLFEDFVRFWDYFIMNKENIFGLSVLTCPSSRDLLLVLLNCKTQNVKVEHFQTAIEKFANAYELKNFRQQKNINSDSISKQKMCWNRNKHEICMTTGTFIRQVLANDIKCSLAYLIWMFLHGK